MMRDRTRGIVKSALLFSVAVVFGAALSQIKTNKGIARRAISTPADEYATVLELPESPNQVREETYDDNHDGIPDYWGVFIRQSEPDACVYLAKDSDFDGVPDEWQIKVGRGHMWMAEKDEDNDGYKDIRRLNLQDYSDDHYWYHYMDLNLDGQLDQQIEMYDNDIIRRLVRIDDRWVRAKRKREGDSLTTWTQNDDGTFVKVVFEGDKWRILGDPRELDAEDLSD